MNFISLHSLDDSLAVSDAAFVYLSNLLFTSFKIRVRSIVDVYQIKKIFTD